MNRVLKTHVYRWIDHTAELELVVEAATEEDVFAEALRGLAELLAGEVGGPPARHAIELAAADRPALLAEWLNELVFLADTEQFVPERVVALDLRDDGLRAVVEGQHGEPSTLVKAVTYHGLELAREGVGWRAKVVLDV